MTFEYTVHSMAAMLGKGHHPWWALAKAVESAMEANPNVGILLKKEFDKIVGDDDETDPGAGAESSSDGARAKTTGTKAASTGRKTPAGTRRRKSKTV